MTRSHPDTGIIVLAHGSRDPQWRAPIEAVADILAQRHPHWMVTCAYLELCEPALPQVLDQWNAAGVQRVSIHPLFLGAGRHVREDLPRMIDALRDQFPQMNLTLHTPIGENARLTAFMADLITESMTPSQA